MGVIVEMRKSGHKLQEIADTLTIPRGTVSDVVVRLRAEDQWKTNLIQDVIICWTRETHAGLLG
jgi:orotate phosphoribosyltransferase-like protein